MQRRWIWCAAAALALGGCQQMHDMGDKMKGESETTISKSDLPAAVNDTITREYPGGKVTKVEKATKKDGSVVYEVTVTDSSGNSHKRHWDATGTSVKD